MQRTHMQGWVKDCKILAKLVFLTLVSNSFIKIARFNKHSDRIKLAYTLHRQKISGKQINTQVCLLDILEYLCTNT